MASTTRTMNPLHFEDLEPKRFEDLVRQLTYDLKDWRRLEATGRSGADEGFDARGYEKRARMESSRVDTEYDEDEMEEDAASDLLWLVQCKREKAITPKKMVAHLTNIRLAPTEPLYGIIFAAACDFSKSTRDVLVNWCRENGVSEWHIWGKAEIEDQLLQPKNDALLFAYFGISLTIRRRSQVTELRRQIATKRKLKRFLEAQNEGLVLVRDLDATTYPYLENGESRPPWRVRRILSLSATGLVIKTSMRPAWLSEDSSQWDAAINASGQDLAHGRDVWKEKTQEEEEVDQLASDAWQALPASEKAWLYGEFILPYSNIVLIDDIGDDCFDGPHLLVTGWASGYRDGRLYIETIERASKRTLEVEGPDTPGRAAIYPEKTRHLSKPRWGY